MKSRHSLKVVLLTALTCLASLAFAASTTLDQIPIPLTSTGNSELLVQSVPVTGGTLYVTSLRQPGPQGAVMGVGSSFVSTGTATPSRYFDLTNGKSDLGVPMTAAAGTPSGTMGVARTAGTSLALVGEVTSSNAKTDKVMFETNLSSNYVAGANIPVVVNAIVTGSGTLTGASTTITVAAYSVSAAGVETALTVSAAQQFDKTGETLTYTITGTNLTPLQHVVVELTVLVTTSSGANTGQVNSVSIQG